MNNLLEMRNNNKEIIVKILVERSVNFVDNNKKSQSTNANNANTKNTNNANKVEFATETDMNTNKKANKNNSTNCR